MSLSFGDEKGTSVNKREQRAAEKAAREAFAKKVKTLRVKKGWNQSELARQAAKFTPNNTFGRDNVSKYELALTTPTPVLLMGLAKALGVSPGDLLPSRGAALDEPMDETAALDVRQIDRKRAWIRLNQEVPLDVALKIMTLLHNKER